MAYVMPPEPPDSDVIMVVDGEPYTWGQHRQMEKMLADLEASSPAVAAARQKLDSAMAFYEQDLEMICQYCHQPESKQHEFDCPDHNDPAYWVKREAGGYKYLDDRFRHVHQTSVPMTDQEALEYFGIVQLMFPREGPDFRVTYIMRRDPGKYEFTMMPWTYDKDTKEVTPIERSGA